MTNNQNTMSHVALLIVKKGLSSSSLANATAKVVQTWNQASSSYATVLLEQISCLSSLEPRNSGHEMIDRCKKLLGPEKLMTLFRHYTTQSVLWTMNEHKIINYEVDSESYDRIARQCQEFEKKLEFVNVMDYGEGVIFIGPCSKDSPVFANFQRIVLNQPAPESS